MPSAIERIWHNDGMFLRRKQHLPSKNLYLQSSAPASVVSRQINRDRGCHRVLAVPMVIVKCIRRARPFEGDHGVVRMKVVDSQWVVEAVWLLRQLQ
jgi:hypothetical protein